MATKKKSKNNKTGEDFLKKALENMNKLNLDVSDDSQIFNMERNDKITSNINQEKEKTNKLVRNSLHTKNLTNSKLKSLMNTAKDYANYENKNSGTIDNSPQKLDRKIAANILSPISTTNNNLFLDENLKYHLY